MKSEDKLNPKGKDIFPFFVDEDKYESEEQTLTGAAIKLRLPDPKRSYALYREAHGNDPDLLINDADTVSLEKDRGPARFYTVPPATFGSV